jgi:hypothetical protein
MGYGIASQGDVLVNKLADGVDLNTIWKTIGDALEVWNDERASVARLLSFPTVNAADVVPQRLNAFEFEQASEYGVPVGVSPQKDFEKLGNTIADWDLRTPFTWKFLRQADRRQVISIVNDILAADSKKVNGSVIKRILNPAPELNDFGQTCYGLWNGDSMVPLPHMGVTFGSHSHYIASGATQIDSADIEDAVRLVTEHGYGVSATSQILILANPVDGQDIQSWRAGVESRASGPKANYDFVRSPIAPAFLTQDHIQGRQAPADYQGLPVQGSYGRGWLIESNYVPAGYVIVAASGGPDSDTNPVAIRSHTDPAYQGLLRIPGNGKYPLVESFFLRTFGVGTRHRSAAVAIQVTASPTYTAPADSQIFV